MIYENIKAQIDEILMDGKEIQIIVLSKKDWDFFVDQMKLFTYPIGSLDQFHKDCRITPAKKGKLFGCDFIVSDYCLESKVY